MASSEEEPPGGERVVQSVSDNSRPASKSYAALLRSNLPTTWNLNVIEITLEKDFGGPFHVLGDNIFIVLVFVLYIIKTRFNQNSSISWFFIRVLYFFHDVVGPLEYLISGIVVFSCDSSSISHNVGLSVGLSSFLKVVCCC